MIHPSFTDLASFDPEVFQAIESEKKRQEDHIELIASENYASERVMATQGCVMTNKYAEGYPGKRYYGGCEYVDVVERLAIERACQLFQTTFANVQPHSGSQANAASYAALVQPGDTILGMDLRHGGHLTHGASVSFSGKIYHAIQYGVDSNGWIDYAQVEKLAMTHRPKLIIAGFSAYSRVADWNIFRQIADMVGAYLLVDMAHVAGLVAAGLYPSPVNIADITTTTTHKTLRGPRGGVIFSKSNEDIQKRINSAVFPGDQGGPLMHVIAAKAVAFKEAMSPDFKTYQEQVLKNAQVMAHCFMERGLKVVSDGTDCHLFLVSLIDQKMTGKEAVEWLSQANIIVNKNTVPNDPLSPFITSGIRIGTPAITTRGFKEEQGVQVAHGICDILLDRGKQKTIDQIRNQMIDLCRSFPVYVLKMSK